MVQEMGHGKVVPWSKWRWKHNFEGWFVRTLGSFIKKGYLRVVPAIDLLECDLDQVENG